MYTCCLFFKEVYAVDCFAFFPFCSNVKIFIQRNLESKTFALVIHGGADGRGAIVNCLPLARKFYKLLRDRLEFFVYDTQGGSDGATYC